MATTSAPPLSEADQELLRGNRFLQEPTQQAILNEYFSNSAGSEETVYKLLEDIKQRAPQLEKELNRLAHERAERAREEAEMAENKEKSTPTIIRQSERTVEPTTTSNEDSEEAPLNAEVSPHVLLELPVGPPVQATDDSEWDTNQNQDTHTPDWADDL